MNEFFDAVKARLRSPILGYLLLTSLAINWRSFFYLLVDNGTVPSRIAYVDSHTSLWSLLVVPAIFAVAIILANPWVSYLISLAASKPLHLGAVLNANAEHRLLMEKKKLEDARAGLLASAENELIERARRDQQVDRLENEELRERLRSELDQLRAEREALRASNPQEEDTLTKEAAQLLLAAADGDGTVMLLRHLGGTRVQAGGNDFLADKSRRAEAKWEAAVRELAGYELIEDKSGKGEMYFLTSTGFSVADDLRKR